MQKPTIGMTKWAIGYRNCALTPDACCAACEHYVALEGSGLHLCHKHNLTTYPDAGCDDMTKKMPR